MPDQNLLPPGPGRLTGGGVAFDVFVRPSGFVAVDEAQLRAIQRRHRRRLIGQGVAWVGKAGHEPARGPPRRRARSGVGRYLACPIEVRFAG